MFPLLRKFSFYPDAEGAETESGRSLQDIEEAKLWVAAQWRRPAIPTLKVRDSLLIDVQRWRKHGFEQLDGGLDDQSSCSSSGSMKDEKLALAARSSHNQDTIRFTLLRKVCIASSIVLMTAMSLLAYTVISAVSGSIAEEFGTANDLTKTLYGSIYLLGVAIGSVLAAPLSERYGRLPIYHASNVSLILAIIGCANASSPSMLLLMRWLSGVAGCSSLVLGGPTIRDIVYAEQQCHNKALWSLCRLSPLIGYIAAQFGTSIGKSLIQSSDWRTMFRALAVAAVIVTAVSALLLTETYGPRIEAGMAIGLLYLLFAYPYFSLTAGADRRLEELLIMTVPAALLMPVGIFLYGWSLHSHWSSIAPIVATGMIGASFLTTFVPIQIYLIDTFAIHSASAVAPAILLQNLVGTFLPLAATHMLNLFGIWWMSSVLGCCALLFLPFPLLFIRYGRCLQSWSFGSMRT